VFERAWDIAGQLGPTSGALQIADLHRLPATDGHCDPLWHLEGEQFDLRLRAPGYVQYVRRVPSTSRVKC
jgi:hypothetical protein